MSDQERQKCVICDDPLCVKWTDRHGVAECITCEAPYRIYHYEDDRRVDKPPAITFNDEYLPLFREYWQRCRRKLAGGTYISPPSREWAENRNACVDWIRDQPQPSQAPPASQDATR